jgi:hypothetical protein
VIDTPPVARVVRGIESKASAIPIVTTNASFFIFLKASLAALAQNYSSYVSFPAIFASSSSYL